MSGSSVLLERIGGTALITLNRPQRRNALDTSIRLAMIDIVGSVQADRSVKAVVLTGAGGNFCAGADLGDGGEPEDKGFYVRDLLQDHHRWFATLADLEKPVISAVDGFATGAGLSVALAADFIVASDRARFVSSFARVGFVPDLALMHVLPRRVGLVRAREIVFSAREVRADEGLAIGLADIVVPADDLRDTAIALARRFEHAPTQVLGMAKRILNRSFETDRQALLQEEAGLQGLCAASRYNTEALRRFLAQEAPMFPGTERLF